MEYKFSSGLHRFWFDTNPVPASRPRVSKWGVYYGKTYKAFRAAFAAEVEDFRMEFRPLLATRLRVDVAFSAKKPKTSKLPHPRGDIDNYPKALFDSCNAVAWRDDVQIVEVTAIKQRSEGEGFMTLDIEELSDE